MRRHWDPTAPAIILACAMLAGVYAMSGGLGPGEWRGTLSKDRRSVGFVMRLDEGKFETHFGTTVPTGELDGFDAASFERSGAPVRLVWKRDAGSFVLEGKGGRHPFGSVRFEPAAAFRETWKTLGLGPLEDRYLVAMAISGVRLADVQSLKASGVEDLDAEGVIRLADDPEAMRWVTELQGRGAPVHLRDVFRLRDHGLRPSTYREYERSGVATDVEGIVRLHDRGVAPDYVAAVIHAGIDPGDLDGIERLHDHGVSPKYAAGVLAAGLEHAGVDDVVRLHDQGVAVDYVRGATDSGLAGITLQGIVRLHAHGVPVDYVRAVARYGPGDRAVDDAIRLHDSGVPTEFLRSHVAQGTSRPSTGETIRSWSRGGEPSSATK